MDDERTQRIREATTQLEAIVAEINTIEAGWLLIEMGEGYYAQRTLKQQDGRELRISYDEQMGRKPPRFTFLVISPKDILLLVGDMKNWPVEATYPARHSLQEIARLAFRDLLAPYNEHVAKRRELYKKQQHEHNARCSVVRRIVGAEPRIDGAGTALYKGTIGEIVSYVRADQHGISIGFDNVPEELAALLVRTTQEYLATNH